MTAIPKAHWFDQTLSLLREGNEFISHQCKRLGSDVFQTRLLLKKTICLRGREAAEIFYDNDKFIRHGAAPSRLQRTLTGKEGVQGLDGQAHQHRKAMFMSLMSSERIADLTDIFQAHWIENAKQWPQQESVSLYNEVNHICFLAAAQWSGIDLSTVNAHKQTENMVAMIESPASIGPSHVKGIIARQRAERWAQKLIQDSRDNATNSDKHCALHVFAHYRSPNGSLIDAKAAAVDLLNIIRPIVAIGRYVCFCAFALHKHPEYHSTLANGSDDDIHHFVQEVRRYYPYFPFAAAKVARDFTWQGYRFEQGTRVLLDLYGTNRAPGMWRQADEFNPERFAKRENDAFALIPQGGGFYDKHHRCAGEWITLALMESAVRFLTSSMTYRAVNSHVSIDLTAMPTLPDDGFLMTAVKLTKDADKRWQNSKIMRDYGTDSQSADAADFSVAGEEDPGAALEAFVESERTHPHV
ncbi:cytochrome P450 [Alteromonas oceanisediminis]|uniref:cytochrome P450 n=1 Tax=Alteromonas oceanisediminis TaxID=2836180 RepID=UPI001BDB2D0A|nr:cytochrome P450 [Alteromonas oceanisediminis]MBT0585189.1 cytochrome P450 [Alteromonas oceanisediminis]